MVDNILLVGSGGVGQAIKAIAEASGHQVTIVTHNPQKALSEGHQIDLTQPNQVDGLVPIIEATQPTLVINTIGMLMQGDHGPEKNIQQIDKDWLNKSVDVNVWPAVQIAQALARVKKRSDHFKFLTFSARVASISDNKLGGWYSYRMSKATLNMFIKTLSIEWKRQLPHAAIYGYHPGTVDTDLSRPFHNNVPAGKLFTPQQAAEYCMNVLTQLTIEDTGHLVDWRGDNIEW